MLRDFDLSRYREMTRDALLDAAVLLNGYLPYAHDDHKGEVISLVQDMEAMASHIDSAIVLPSDINFRNYTNTGDPQ